MPIFFALRFEGGVAGQFLLKQLNCISEKRRGNSRTRLVMHFDKIVQFQFGLGPDIG